MAGAAHIMRPDPAGTGHAWLSGLARSCGVTQAALRSWLRRGLLDLLMPPAECAWQEPGACFRARRVFRALGRLHLCGWTARRIDVELRGALAWITNPVEALDALVCALGSGRAWLALPDGRRVDRSGQLWLPLDDEDFGSVLRHRSHAQWFELGVVAEREGRLAAAIQAYEQAKHGGDPRAWFNLGNVHRQQGDRFLALDAYGRAIELRPFYIEAWNNLGVVQVELGQLGEALGAFRQALRYAPWYADAHFNLADALAALGHLEPARSHWRAYLLHDASSAWAELARSRLGIGNAAPGTGIGCEAGRIE